MKSLVKYVDTKHAFLYVKLVWTYSSYELIEFCHNYPEYLIKWHAL
jgi:hypothetical protein